MSRNRKRSLFTTTSRFYFEGNIIIGLLCINTWFCGKLSSSSFSIIELFIVKLARGSSCLRVNYRHLNTFNQSLPKLNQTDFKQAGGWRTWSSEARNLRSVPQPSAPTSSSTNKLYFLKVTCRSHEAVHLCSHMDSPICTSRREYNWFRSSSSL